MAQKDEKIKEAEAAAKDAARRLEEIERREMELSEARKDIENARQKAEALAEKEAQIAEKEAQLKALEERLTREAEEKTARKADQQRKEEEQVTSEADIASRIAAFENELSMPCPVCQTGKVVTQTTEKGKSFYSCSSRDCRFVSWDKPYHFECPLCKNSFLTEFDAGSDQKGLKCPRASCAYTQPNLLDPRQNMAAAASEAAPRKKKRIVRRKKKR